MYEKVEINELYEALIIELENKIKLLEARNAILDELIQKYCE